jgi:outer membrane immunogenic protein
MKNKLTFSLFSFIVLIGLGSSNIHAQSSFAGFYGQISTGWDQNTAKSSSPSITTSRWGSATGTASDTGSWGYAPLNVGVGYIYEVIPKWTLGVGADYSLYMPNSNNVTTDFKGQLATNKVSYYYTAKDRYNLYITPGYAIDKDKLAYVKLG